MKEMINHPDHYNKHKSGIECIDVVEHMNFNIGNAIKYVWRCNHKENKLQDLKKALWYVEREVKRSEIYGNPDTIDFQHSISLMDVMSNMYTNYAVIIEALWFQQMGIYCRENLKIAIEVLNMEISENEMHT